MSLKDYTIKDIEKVVKIANNKSITKVDIKRLTAPGENYLSLVFSVDFEVTEDGKTETVKTVVKRLPLGKRMEFDFNAVAMKNEIRWYSELVPLLIQFGKDYGIDTDYYPKYLGSRLSLDTSKSDADSESVLIIENLIPQGYINEDRHVGFDIKTAKAILKDLAQFHAIPLAMKFKNPELFKTIKDFLDSTAPSFGPDGPPGNDKKPDDQPPEYLLFDKIIEMPACQRFVSNIKKMKENLVPMHELFKGGKHEPWCTIVHCDFWVNNIMVKSQPEGGKIFVKILDFQISIYASYARDLVFFLLTSLKDNVLKKNIDELLRYYYEEFTSILDRFPVPELKLSYEAFLEEIKQVALKYEVAHSMTFCNIIQAPKGSQPDLLAGEGDVFDHMKVMILNMNDRQKEKIALVVETCAERGWM